MTWGYFVHNIDIPFLDSRLECNPYSCDIVETRIGFNLNNLTWPTAEPSLLPTDTFPVDAGHFTIDAPAENYTADSWTVGVSADNQIIPMTVNGINPCSVQGHQFAVYDSNSIHTLRVIGEAKESLYGVALVAGNRSSSGQNLPEGSLFSITRDYQRNGLADFSQTAQLVLGQNSINETVTVELNTQRVWNGVSGQGASASGNISQTSAALPAYTANDEKSYHLLVIEYNLDIDNITVETFLLNGLFTRYNGYIDEVFKVHHYYFDDEGDEQYVVHDYSNTLAIFVNATTLPTTITPKARQDIRLAFGELRLAGYYFAATPVNGNDVWLAVKQNRSSYTQPAYC